MTHRAWLLVALAYTLGAVGLLVALVLIGRQQDDIDAQTQRLTEAAGFYCQALQAPTRARRTQLLALYAGGQSIRLGPLCQSVVDQLDH